MRWLRLLYVDFSAFTKDQEYLISLNADGEGGPTKGFDYLEGSVVNDESLINNWRSSFFSKGDHRRISALAAHHSIIYFLEVSKYYSHFGGPTTVDQVGTHYPLPKTSFLFSSILFSSLMSD